MKPHHVIFTGFKFVRVKECDKTLVNICCTFFIKILKLYIKTPHVVCKYVLNVKQITVSLRRCLQHIRVLCVDFIDHRYELFLYRK
jgi:hypothetical protein